MYYFLSNFNSYKTIKQTQNNFTYNSDKMPNMLNFKTNNKKNNLNKIIEELFI